MTIEKDEKKVQASEIIKNIQWVARGACPPRIVDC